MMQRRSFISLSLLPFTTGFSPLLAFRRAQAQGWEPFLIAYGSALAGAVAGAILDHNAPDKGKWLEDAIAAINMKLDTILNQLSSVSLQLGMIERRVTELSDEIVQEFLRTEIFGFILFVNNLFESYKGDFKNPDFISDMRQVFYESRRTLSRVRAHEPRIAPAAIFLLPVIISSGLNSEEDPDTAKILEIKGSSLALLNFLEDSLSPEKRGSLYEIRNIAEKEFNDVDKKINDLKIPHLSKWSSGSIRILYRVNYLGDPINGFTYEMPVLLQTPQTLIPPQVDQRFTAAVSQSALPDVPWDIAGKDTDALVYTQSRAQAKVDQMNILSPLWRFHKERLEQAKTAYDVVDKFLRETKKNIYKLDSA